MHELQHIPGGRIPPQAINFEEAILGSMLIDQSAISEVFHMLSEETFYKSQHKMIFQAIYQVYTSKDSVDILTVSQELREKGKLEHAGGEYLLIELSNKVSSSAHIEYHARIVIQKFIQRQIIANASKIIEQAFDETTDVFDLIDTAYSDLNAVSEMSVKPQEHPIGDLIQPQIEMARKIETGEIKPGIPTPFYQLTSRMGGWRGGELIVLAARPAMGKTALAIKYGMHAARLGYPAAFFSLEMSKETLTNRVIASEARLDGDKFTNSGLTIEEAEHAIQATRVFRELPFYIDDTPSISIENFKVNAKRMKSQLGIKLIIIDYLQLMGGSTKGGNREQEISKISRGLKIVAKELGVAVIALSQLSRAVEAQGGHKRPMLSHLRESGAIEQDADVVQFLYRPEYYRIDNWDDYQGAPTEGEAEYIVAKNRNGGLIRNRMGFEGRYTNFHDLDEPKPNQLPLSPIAEISAFQEDDGHNAF
jgi:replicative DNA helicase